MTETGSALSPSDVKALLDALPKSRRALARLISLIEDRGALVEHDDALAIRDPHLRVWGITGPPGAGKSTLVACMVDELSKHHRVAVLAIDPSSPFSGGALLGDRIRMARHSGKDAVFIRSLATRLAHGGLTRGTRQAVAACGLAGFDTVLVETAGVGQTELAILEVADTVGVVLVPEAGDSIQGMKAGILEIGDVFLVNKADRPGADKLVAVLQEESAQRSAGWTPMVLACSAVQGLGIAEAVQAFEEHARYRHHHPSRHRTAKARLESALELRLHQSIHSLMASPQGQEAVQEVENGAAAGRVAQRLLEGGDEPCE